MTVQRRDLLKAGIALTATILEAMARPVMQTLRIGMTTSAKLVSGFSQVTVASR